jgi:hypothetical protein
MPLICSEPSATHRVSDGRSAEQVAVRASSQPASGPTPCLHPRAPPAPDEENRTARPTYSRRWSCRNARLPRRRAGLHVAATGRYVLMAGDTYNLRAPETSGVRSSPPVSPQAAGPLAGSCARRDREPGPRRRAAARCYHDHANGPVRSLRGVVGRPGPRPTRPCPHAARGAAPHAMAPPLSPSPHAPLRDTSHAS